MVALARLQDDMQSVLERLHTLEALSASQVRPRPHRKLRLKDTAGLLAHTLTGMNAVFLL